MSSAHNAIANMDKADHGILDPGDAGAINPGNSGNRQPSYGDIGNQDTCHSDSGRLNHQDGDGYGCGWTA